jgi:hypothetical protein
MMSLDGSEIVNQVIAAILVALIIYLISTVRRLANWFVVRAVRHLPPAERERYVEEWGGDISVAPAFVALAHAFDLWRRASAVREALEPNTDAAALRFPLSNLEHHTAAEIFVLRCLAYYTRVATNVEPRCLRLKLISAARVAITQIKRRKVTRVVKREAKRSVIYRLQVPGGPQRVVPDRRFMRSHIEMRVVLEMDSDARLVFVPIRDARAADATNE